MRSGPTPSSSSGFRARDGSRVSGAGGGSTLSGSEEGPQAVSITASSEISSAMGSGAVTERACVGKTRCPIRLRRYGRGSIGKRRKDMIFNTKDQSTMITHTPSQLKGQAE